ncbi:MAG: thioredoxin-disulfide reductase [Desulfovibrio sp.]|nr:thioredoxin-disulfide reductase [Desulfovibrio sp.]
MIHRSDVAVIGAGPAGMTAALYLARSGCSVMMFEQLTPGGQILQTEGLENYPGFPNGVKGYELADYMNAQLAPYDIARPLGEISGITGSAGAFVLRAEAGQDTYETRAVIVCSGVFHKHLGLPGENRLLGHGVSYCALCDGNFYRNQPVAVVGGGNSALEESLYLAKIASQVHLIHRRDEFRGDMIYQKKLEQLGDKVIIHRSAVIEELEGDKDLNGLVIRDVKTNETSSIMVNGLFIYVGFIPSTKFLPEGAETDAQGFLVTDTEMRTSIPGIFAAGDVRSKMCRQVITAAGDGATAAHAAFVFLEHLDA